MSRRKPTKLTLSIDPTVIRRAKAYAEVHRTSVSELVEGFLRRLTDGDSKSVSTDPWSWPPAVRELLGVLPAAAGDADIDDHRFRRLAEKYLHD